MRSICLTIVHSNIAGEQSSEANAYDDENYFRDEGKKQDVVDHDSLCPIFAKQERVMGAMVYFRYPNENWPIPKLRFSV